MAKLSLIGVFVIATAIAGCKNECVTCTGPTAPRKYCPGDYQERSDFQNDVSAYEAAGGECE